VSRPNLHHYVPRSYLARFTDGKGFLHLYDKSAQSFRRQRPEKVMKINAYYRQVWAPPGVDPDILESRLGEWLEAEARVALDVLIEKSHELTDQQLADFLVYLELQRVRVPRQAEIAKELMRQTILQLVPEAAAAAASGQIQLSMKDSTRFDYMRWSLGMFSPWFETMEWEIVDAEPGSAFITTDSPVSLYNPAILPPAEAGIGLAGTVVFFPLSSKKLLLMRHAQNRGEPQPPLAALPQPEHEDGFVTIDVGAVWPKDMVQRLNWKLSCLSSSLIVGESSEVLEASLA